MILKKFLYHFIYFFNKNLFVNFIGVNFGKNCRFYTRYFGSEPYLISFGNNVIVSDNVKFITHDGSYALLNKQNQRRYFISEINIGNNVFIGSSSIILPGTNIGDNVIIGAGSVVTKSIPSNTVFAGNPAKKIKTFQEFTKTNHKKSLSKKEMKKFLNQKNKL